MSDTPRTDALVIELLSEPDCDAAYDRMDDLARQLERELAEKEGAMTLYADILNEIVEDVEFKSQPIGFRDWVIGFIRIKLHGLPESAKHDARILEAARLFVAAKTCVPGKDLRA